MTRLISVLEVHRYAPELNKLHLLEWVTSRQSTVFPYSETIPLGQMSDRLPTNTEDWIRP
ncbi:hypothetical protein COOFOMLJ_03658 [Aeromonas veronii]